ELKPRLAAQPDVDVEVPRIPWIAQQFSPKVLEMNRECVSQKIQCGAQWCTPTLVPAGSATRVASTITLPAAHPVCATPGASFAEFAMTDLDFKFGRMVVKKLTIVGHAHSGLGRLDLQRVSQREIAELEMMSVCFAVRGDVYQ